MPPPESKRPDVPNLIDGIQPELCEHIWAEPYNDHDNWRYVRGAFNEGSAMWNWLTQV